MAPFFGRSDDLERAFRADGDDTFLVNGIVVLAFVEAELDRRGPGRTYAQPSFPKWVTSPTNTY